MGKAKSNGNRNRGGDKNNTPYGKAGGTAKGESDKNSLVDDLGSLDETRRSNACKLIADIFASSRGNSFEVVALKPVLSALIMRLVDASVDVRVEAARAIRNMACSSNVAIVQKMVDAGVVRTALGLISSYCASIGDATSTPATGSSAVPTENVSEQLLASLAGMISSCEDAYDDLAGYEDAMPMLLRLVASVGSRAGMRREAAHILGTATEGDSRCCELTVAAGGIETIGALFASGAGAASVGGEIAASESLVLVACAAVFVNLYSWAKDEVMQQRCSLPAVLQQLVGFTSLSASTYQQVCETAAPAIEQGAEAAGAEAEDTDASVALSQSLSVVKAAAEVAANVAILLNNDKEASESGERTGARSTATHEQLVEYCHTNNMFGACGSSALQQFEALTNITSKVSSNERKISTSTTAIVENMDRLLTVLLNMAESQGTFLSDNLGILPLVVRMADYLIVCVQSTITTVDAEGKKSTIWNIDTDEVSSTETMNKFASCASTALGLIASVLRNIEVPSDDEFWKSVVALLMRGLTMPNYDIASSCIELGSVVGTKTVPLNAVMSNAILRKIDSPRVFKLRVNSNGTQVNADASMLMVGICIDAIIDMHSSDDTAVLQNFIKLNVGGKIESAIAGIVAKLEQETTGELDKEEKSHVAEIVENAQNFLAYKLESIENK